MGTQDKYEQKREAREDQDRKLAKIMGLTIEEYKAIECEPTTDLDGSLKVYWSSNADSGIVAKIKNKQALDDDHVTISQDMSQLGEPY